MQETHVTEETPWYVLNFIRTPGVQSPAKAIDDFNRDGHSLELFAPVVRPAHLVNGRVVYRDRLLTYCYIFVRGTLGEVKELCSSPSNGLSMMLDRSSERRYGALTDTQMESFRIIARAYTNTVPFFNIADIDLEEGDVVEVVGGDYAGLRGVFMPRARSNRGNLVIAATADMGAVVWDIEARYIRILRFARDTRRQYDIIDSFIPRLLAVLRRFHAGGPLPDRDKSLLAVFNQRMGTVVPDNHKLEAKLLATLMCVRTVIGDTAGHDAAAARFARRRQAVTNPWTVALMELMLSVAHGDMTRLREAHSSLPPAPSSLTATQSALLSEFRHYLPQAVKPAPTESHDHAN